MSGLKSYRENELKWFLLANILLMIANTDVFEFGATMNSLVSGIASLLSVTVFSSAIYILTFVLDSVIPSVVKVKMLFLWTRQPSCTIFTDMERKVEDNRFAIEDAKKRYKSEYKKIANRPKNFDQTPLWYAIYNRHRDNANVFGSNRDYLLLRDMHAQTIMLMLLYVILCFMTQTVSFSAKFIVYLTVLAIMLNIGARVRGKRVIYNVLSVDINQALSSDTNGK